MNRVGPPGQGSAAAPISFCEGLTYWDFRPFVEQNGAIGWKLLERMALMLRDARQGLESRP
jgi:hypothetical protein